MGRSQWSSALEESNTSRHQFIWETEEGHHVEDEQTEQLLTRSNIQY